MKAVNPDSQNNVGKLNHHCEHKPDKQQWVNQSQ